MPLARDLLHPSPAEEKRKHKLKRLVQHPNSYFMDVKCPASSCTLCTGDVTRSPQSSAMHKVWLYVPGVPQSFANQQAAGRGLQKVIILSSQVVVVTL
ncbi:hypothetical protein B566_EDAN005122 [Ephemera danica]|nr:hypothetical protein B566_EDAN005122 [Ephemera danica]